MVICRGVSVRRPVMVPLTRRARRSGPVVSGGGFRVRPAGELLRTNRLRAGGRIPLRPGSERFRRCQSGGPTN